MPISDCVFILPRFLHKNCIDLQIFAMDWMAKCHQKRVMVCKNQMVLWVMVCKKHQSW